ncbi:MAG TPA: hypothetical protein DIU15_19155 [Deltaproteobacteria bacterium]|nr:hypothetical protein [Deltaproteobacteria bacterium]
MPSLSDRILSLRRETTDRLLAAVARLGGFLVPLLPSLLVHLLSVSLGALVCTMAWPFSDLRRRIRQSGVRVSPAVLGACYGRNLAILLGAPCPLNVRGWKDGAGATRKRGRVVLAAHLGPWEAGGQVLSQRGLDSAVIAAPWPGLPRTARVVARLRRRNGVQTFFRGRAGWRAATEHLRSGGCVVVLVDSGRGSGPHRRAGPFVDEAVAAPDAVVAWAQRQGADVWVAAGRSDGFDLHELDPKPLQAPVLADEALAILRGAALSQPSQWGWVRALAVCALWVVCGGWGCNVGPLPPPLPLDPAGWTVEAEQVQWSGPVAGHGQGHFAAHRAVGTWEAGQPQGRFEGVTLSLSGTKGSMSLAHIEAASAHGSWPDGPLHLFGVRWGLEAGVLEDVPEGLRSGALADATWLGDAGWNCGGCLLETLAQVANPPASPGNASGDAGGKRPSAL